MTGPTIEEILAHPHLSVGSDAADLDPFDFSGLTRKQLEDVISASYLLAELLLQFGVTEKEINREIVMLVLDLLLMYRVINGTF